MQMPIKKWLRQYAFALPALVVLFTFTQYIQGHNLDDSVSFALFWAVVSLGIFAATRAWNFHRNQYCALCNDFPEVRDESKSEQP